MKITGARVFINGKFHDVEVKFDNEKILAIGYNLEDDEVIDASGKFLYPGLIDTHIHGGYLRNFVKIEHEDEFGSFEDQVRYVCDKITEHGVTTIYPTINPNWSPYEKVGEITRRIRNIRDDIKGAYPLKFCYEAAFMSMERYVEMCKDWTTNPTKEVTDLLVDYDYSDVCMISVAPDMEGALDWIDYVVSKGVMPELCHDKCTAEQLIEAADHGLCIADHLFNGYEPMHHRKSTSSVGVMLDDRVKAQLTMDGVHVAPAWIKLVLKVKGIENCYGVTDFSAYSGLAEGKHDIGDGKIIINKGGFNYFENGHLVNGSYGLNEIMRIARDACDLSMEEVGLLYAENPARITKCTDRGKIEVGRKSDFVIMDVNYNVDKTIINGQIYYQGKNGD